MLEGCPNLIRSEPPARFKSRIASPREPRPSENSNRKHIHSDYSDTRAKESAQAKTSVFCTTNLGVRAVGIDRLQMLHHTSAAD